MCNTILISFFKYFLKQHLYELMSQAAIAYHVWDSIHWPNVKSKIFIIMSLFRLRLINVLYKYCSFIYFSLLFRYDEIRCMEGSYSLSFLLRCGTRPNEWSTSWANNLESSLLFWIKNHGYKTQKVVLVVLVFPPPPSRQYDDFK